jgi:hypothetical protein
MHRGPGRERVGVTLKIREGKKWILIRIGSNPFYDAETRKLSGRSGELEGHRWEMNCAMSPRERSGDLGGVRTYKRNTG